MDLVPQLAVVALAAYLLGSVSFAIAVSRLMALPDPRSYGSGNAGATNVLRTGSKAAAVLTLLGDAGKGTLAVWLASQWRPEPAVLAAAALAVFLGHVYPIFHRFQGGKGAATAAGVLLGLDWRLGAGTLATWLIILVFLRYSSLASLVAAAFASLAAFVLLGMDARLPAVLAMAALLVWRHRANIARLLAGTEPRIGAKKAS